MATMYVYNIPTNETVNLRQTPSTSGTILFRVGYGNAVEASPSSTSGWHNASYNGYTGYIMSQYLTTTNPNGGGTWYTRYVNTPNETLNVRSGPGTSYSIVTRLPHATEVQVNAPSSTWSEVRLPGASVLGYVMTSFLVTTNPNGSGSGGSTTYTIQAMIETDRFGNGGPLTMRAGQSTDSDSIAEISAGTMIYVSTFSGEWLPAKYGTLTGYVMAKFIFNSNEYNEPDSDIIAQTSYIRSNAVAYAMQYAQNYNSSVYEVVPNNKDCANFISQCLYAGGMYMNNTWNYNQPGNLTSRTSAWIGTVSLRDMLNDRKWAYKVYDKTKLKRGDLVYTYESQNDLPHVVIVSRDVGSDGKIFVCGHTSDQNDVERSSTIKSVYYHINDSQGRKAADWRY